MCGTSPSWNYRNMCVCRRLLYSATESSCALTLRYVDLVVTSNIFYKCTVTFWMHCTLVDKIIYCSRYVKWLSVWYVPCKEVLNCISDHTSKLAILHLYIGSWNSCNTSFARHPWEWPQVWSKHVRVGGLLCLSYNIRYS